MSNTLLTVDEITGEALRILHNKLAFTANVDKQHDKDSEIAGQKRSASIRIRKPWKPTVRTGWTINAQDVTEEYDTLTVGTVNGVDMNFTDAELAYTLNDFSRIVLEPAVSYLASKIDADFFTSMYKKVFNLVGTPGTAPAAELVYLQANQKLNEFACPEENRTVIINPAAQAATVNGLVGRFNPSTAISNQYVRGRMSGPAMGYDGWFMSQNVPVHTCGSRVGTILVDGTLSVEGTQTVHIDGLTNATDTITAGDVFTIADVYAVNPETKSSTGALQQFVVLTAATAASNEVDLTVWPKIYTSASGGLQTVSAFPQNDKAVTFVGTASTAYAQNMAFHRDAFTFATARLEMPNDVSFKAQREMDGINIRILRQYDISNSTHPCRLDVFWGGLAQRPEMACRITG